MVATRWKQRAAALGATGLGISAGAIIYAAMHILAGPGIREEGAGSVLASGAIGDSYGQ